MTARRYTPTNRTRPSTRGALLFLLPFPLLLALLVALAKGSLTGVLGNGLGFSLFILGAVIGRKGFKLEQEYNRRKIARAPGTPYKLLAGIVIAIATGVAAFGGAGHGALISLVFCFAAFAGYYLVYGVDPRTDKLGSLQVGVTAEEVVAALDEAETTIKAIEATRDRVGNREFRERLRRITTKAREILKTIEEDPKDLRRARKFLVVYLESTQRVSEGYSRTHERANSADLEQNFRRVLETVERVFEEQHQKLLEDDLLDLDVQIEVLEAQLKREGVI